MNKRKNQSLGETLVLKEGYNIYSSNDAVALLCFGSRKLGDFRT